MSNFTRRMPPRFVVTFGATLLPAILMMVALLVIWPGHLKVWGYLDFVCPPPYNDPRVVVDTHHIAPGETSWTHDLLCLSDTGAIHPVGTGWLYLLDVLLFAVIIAVVALPRLQRAAKSASTAP